MVERREELTKLVSPYAMSEPHIAYRGCQHIPHGNLHPGRRGCVHHQPDPHAQLPQRKRAKKQGSKEARRRRIERSGKEEGVREREGEVQGG